MQPAKSKYDLGLDIGIASVGAALITDDHIHAIHVRTFNKAENAKTGESLNSIRRDARLTRRRIRRRAFRLVRLLRLLHREGLLASPTPDALATDVSPWELRAKGLDGKLEACEWAAVLYHMVKHRGFQSSRKSEAQSDEKLGKLLSGVTANQQRMAKRHWRTVGEMVARDPDFAQVKRNKGGDYSHTFARADLEMELKRLFEAQRALGNPSTSTELYDHVHTFLMARRPALSGSELLKTVGKCTFEPEELRAPKATHTAERFVWLTRLNNLRLNHDGRHRGLTDVERDVIHDLPFSLTKITYKQIRNELDLDDSARFVGVDYWKKRKDGKDEFEAESATLFEAKAFHALRKAYENAGLTTEWRRDSKDPDRLDTLAYAQTVFKEDAEAREWMQGQGIEPEVIEAVLAVSFSAFLHLSLKALKKIVPHLEAGLRYDEAVQDAGYNHHSDLHENKARSAKLPPISRDEIRNPVVFRALNQARKLVNAIVDEYGPPSTVHIELARDLSKPFDERKHIEAGQKAFRRSKEEAIEDFRNLFHSDPRRDQLAKLRLYHEQGCKSAYSLKTIDIERLIEEGYVEIDHALPYSRSFDDSMNNKVLVFTDENRNKGNKTPYEYLGGNEDSERWQRFKTWVENNRNYRPAKRARLLRKDFTGASADGFSERNLNDTRYIARAFKTLIDQHLQFAEGSEKERCVVVTGQTTAFLRARWGLTKVREDGDLHHALDAAVVGAASRGMVKRLSDYSRRKELALVGNDFVDPETGEILNKEALRALDDQFPTPWPHFRQELEAWLTPEPATSLLRIPNYDQERAKVVKAIRVSRAPLRRNLGAAHEETIRSAKLLAEGKSVVNTPLEKLKLKDIERIVGWDDPRNAKLIAAIRERLIASGDDGRKAFDKPLYKPSRPGKTAPIVQSVHLADTQKSGIPVRGGIANNGDMLRIDIFVAGGKYYAVPLYVSDVNKLELPRRAIVVAKPYEEWPFMDENYDFLFSLHQNDWVKVVKSNGQVVEGYFSMIDRSTGAISVWAHDRNPSVGKDGLTRGIGIKTARSVEKFHVDLLGRLYPAGQETRLPLSHKRKG